MVGRPELLVIGAVVGGLACLAVAVGVAALAAWLGLGRSRAPAGPTREEMLRALGYTPAGEPKAWARPFAGTKVVCSEARGLTWTVRLPRYNTLTLAVEERDGGASPTGRPFETDKPILDRRFAFASGSPGPQTLALVLAPAVTRTLLELPWVSLRLSGDELVLADPQRRSVASGADPIEAERAAHLAVEALVGALFETMFSRGSGTIMPEYR